MLQLVVSVCLHLSYSAPIIDDIVNRVLNPTSNRNQLDTPRKPGSLSQLPPVGDISKDNSIIQRATDPGIATLGSPGLPKLRSTPQLLSLPLPKLPPRAPLTSAAINRGFGTVLSLVNILGQIDSYISERARTIIRKMLLVVDDDSTNSANLGTSPPETEAHCDVLLAGTNDLANGEKRNIYHYLEENINSRPANINLVIVILLHINIPDSSTHKETKLANAFIEELVVSTTLTGSAGSTSGHKGHVEFAVKGLQPSVIVDDNVLDEIESTKFIGIQLDRMINWDEHVDGICSKVPRCIYVLLILGKLCSLEVLKIAYFGLAHPLISYGIHLRSSCLKQILERVFKLLTNIASLSKDLKQ
ncbi:hypothetical protein J6590_070369 [Homalodisca vitripennis]|nr:hypothetical protein J6590_070369 [Homalodisca vitripennis]